MPTKVPPVKVLVFQVVMYGCKSWTIKKAECRRTDAFVVLEKILESPLDSKEIKPVNPKGNLSWIFIGKTCWSWNSNTLAIWCKWLTYWKRPWCWERLKAGGGHNRGWDGCMASPTQWTWIWASSGSDGWGSLLCCSLWGCKESDTTKRLNWTDTLSQDLSPWPTCSLIPWSNSIIQIITIWCGMVWMQHSFSTYCMLFCTDISICASFHPKGLKPLKAMTLSNIFCVSEGKGSVESEKQIFNKLNDDMNTLPLVVIINRHYNFIIVNMLTLSKHKEHVPTLFKCQVFYFKAHLMCFKTYQLTKIYKQWYKAIF